MDLRAFPYDISVCEIWISLEQSINCHPQWTPLVSAHFIEDLVAQVALYNVTRFKIHIPKDQPHQIVLRFLIYRTCPSYILTIFLPSALITFLGTITLSHFRMNDFMTRITVTVSILIVISTLYSQIISTIPESPDVKMLELFFFYCIVRLSTVYFIHAVNQTKSSKKRIHPYLPSAKTHQEKINLSLIPGQKAPVFVPGSGFSSISSSFKDQKIFRRKTILIFIGYLLDIAVIAGLVIYVIILRSQRFHEYENSYEQHIDLNKVYSQENTI